MGILTLILTSGYPLREGGDGKTLVMCGFISTMVYFLHLVSIPFSICSVFYMDLPQEKTVRAIDANLMLLIIVGVALIIGSVMICLGRFFTVDNPDHDGNDVEGGGGGGGENHGSSPQSSSQHGLHAQP